jgi:hypothetical protein
MREVKLTLNMIFKKFIVKNPAKTPVRPVLCIRRESSEERIKGKVIRLG